MFHSTTQLVKISFILVETKAVMENIDLMLYKFLKTNISRILCKKNFGMRRRMAEESKNNNTNENKNKRDNQLRTDSR